MSVLVAGVDEAGRGPLAGPVVAAAVILDPDAPIGGLRDSKQLSAARREQLARAIRARALAVGVGQCEHDEIDRLNILQATLVAMQRALLALGRRPETILIDGNRAPPLPEGLDGCGVRAIVGGDGSEPCISAASIIAKTHRDALMVRLDERFPGYGLAQHFGYGTRAHLEALVRLGPSPIHRRSFNPLRGWLAGGTPD